MSRGFIIRGLLTLVLVTSSVSCVSRSAGKVGPYLSGCFAKDAFQGWSGTGGAFWAYEMPSATSI